MKHYFTSVLLILLLGAASPALRAGPAGAATHPLVGNWLAKDGDKLTFRRPDKSGESKVSGLGMEVSYSVTWKKKPTRGFSLALTYGEDPSPAAKV